MNRRKLLLGALSIGALSASSLAFAGVSPRARRHLLGAAWERAVTAGMPLLVLVVPDEAGHWKRGRRIGAWLNNAPDEDLAPLGAVELACATLGELDKLVPGVSDADGAWMVLVRVDQPTPTWRSIVVPEAPAKSERVRFEDWVKSQQDVGEVPDDADWSALQQGFAAFEREQTRGARQAMLGAFRGSVGRVLASEGLQPEPGSVSSLAALARERWIAKPPPGAHWAQSGVCGFYIEPTPDDREDLNSTGIMCGMGHVVAWERRFLTFWDVNRS